MSEENERTGKAPSWRTLVAVALVIVVVFFLPHDSRIPSLENDLVKLKETNADQQRQIDDLKRELEEMKQKE